MRMVICKQNDWAVTGWGGKRTCGKCEDKLCGIFYLILPAIIGDCIAPKVKDNI